MLYRAPRGTSDILPEEQGYWRFVEQKVSQVAGLYGYERLDSPAFEDSSLFIRGVGENTDIVTKEMYTFTDRGGNQLTLRPEGTAPVCRAYLEHGLHNRPQPLKLYYIASIFRYERPQAGRYRQHCQFGFEAIGESDPALDAEIIDMAWRLLGSLGLARLVILVNSIGCRQCRPGYVTALREYYAAHSGELCDECRARLVRNPLRLLDCKNEACQVLTARAPRSSDYLCPECAEHFSSLKRYLGLLGLPYTLDHHLVRGLDYYTRTVMEIKPEGGGAQSTIIGGGRYDDLIEELGGRPAPAVGFAAGIERVVLNLKEQAVAVPPVPRPQVYVAALGDDAREEALQLAATLRQAGTGVTQGLGTKSLKAQLRQANAQGARYAVIIGDEEVGNGTVVLRDMTSAEQETMPRDELYRRAESWG